MPAVYRTTDEIVASRIEDGRSTTVQLENMNLFAYGAFSNVYKGVAQTQSNHRIDVVVKKTWPRLKGAPLEVKILGKLNRLKHKNIVRLLYSYQKSHEGKVCLGLIFEYIPLNLHQYLKTKGRKIDITEVKLITWQLFRGQFHLQRMEICHRDIKPQNLLFNESSGLLKITDFGSSSMESRGTPQPSYHVTRYYRPPELLFGSKSYGCEIDIWSCGCVFGELLKGSVFLPGRSATNQAEIVLDLLGFPNDNDLHNMRVSEVKYNDIVSSYHPENDGPFPAFDFMRDTSNLKARDRRFYVFNNQISQEDMTESVNLLEQILIYNPFRRLSGYELLMKSYFKPLFSSSTVRSNGKPIECLSKDDWNQVKNGDKTITGESTID